MYPVLITVVMAGAVLAAFRTESLGILAAIAIGVVGYAVLITIH